MRLPHEAFNGLQPWRAASHLRDLLMAGGVLPAADKQLCAFERWLGIHLATEFLQRLSERELGSGCPRRSLAGILLSWIGSRTNMRTATSPSSPWLFPGRRAGQPMRADYLARMLSEIGIPAAAGRTSAIRQHAGLVSLGTQARQRWLGPPVSRCLR